MPDLVENPGGVAGDLEEVPVVHARVHGVAVGGQKEQNGDDKNGDKPPDTPSGGFRGGLRPMGFLPGGNLAH